MSPPSVPQTDGMYRGGAVENAFSTELPFSVTNLRYDLTPMCNVSVIATENGLIPPTSIPILIKEYNKQQPTLSATGVGGNGTASVNVA